MHGLRWNWALAYQIVIWLAQCAGSYLGCLLVWTILRGKRPEHAKRWMNWIAHLKRFREKGTLRLNEMWLAGIFAAGVLIMLGMGYQNLKNPISEEHNVAVLAKTGYNEWDMYDDEQGEFRFKACDDFPNEKVIKPGWMAPRARWQELGECKTIRATGLGFWWKYPDGTFKEIVYGSNRQWATRRWTSSGQMDQVQHAGTR